MKEMIIVLIILLFAIDVGNANESVEYHAPRDERNIVNVVHEALNTDNIFKVSANSNNKMIMNNIKKQEYLVEFNAFGANHKIKLRSHHDDPELASAFGDNYGVYSMKKDKKSGKNKPLRHADSLGDADAIKDCIYKGEREDGGIAVYVACKGIDYLLITNVDGNENEQIEVRKDKRSGKMKASKTQFSNLRHIDNADTLKSQSPSENNGKDGDRRQLAANECTTSPQKYLSMVIVNTISRVNAFSSNAEVEADTISQFLTGKVSYDRTTTPLGCNVQLRLAGQVFETANNKLIKEPFCNEVDEELAAIQTSHNANSGPNGCCSKYPIVWANCPSGETKCWNANAPNSVTGWTTAASHPAPGVDFTTDGGCYDYQSYVTWYLGDKSVTYYGLGDPYLISNSATQISHGLFLDYTSAYFENNAATLRATFGDVDNVQAWTQNDMHSGVAGLAWVGTQCSDSGSTAVITAKYGVYVWLHELGHNLGMNHKPSGIMGRRQLIDFFAPENEVEMEDFLINSYGVDGGSRCLENNPPSKSPTLRPTRRPDWVPTNMPTAGNGGSCDPYSCGGRNCGEGNSCWMNGVCYDWNGVGAYESCTSYVCDPGLTCNPDTKTCIPCTGTDAPTRDYIQGGAVGDRCNVNECGASNCDSNLTCDSDGVCKAPGNVAVGAICRQNFCQKGLTCNPITDTCTACPPTKSPTTNAPSTGEPTSTPSPTTQAPSSTSLCSTVTKKAKCKKTQGCKWKASSKSCSTKN